MNITSDYDYQITVVRHSDRIHWVVKGGVRRIIDGGSSGLAVPVNPDSDELLKEVLDLDEHGFIAPDALGDTSSLKDLMDLMSESDAMGGYGPVSQTEGEEVVEFNLIFGAAETLPSETVEIDLKHSLWSCDLESFPEDVLALMRAAFDGTGTALSVRTAPKREIRYGLVKIYHGCMEYQFHTEWDDTEALVSEDLEELTDAQQTYLLDRVSDWLSMHKYLLAVDHEVMSEDNIGAAASGKVVGDDFEAALKRVDQGEEDLLERDKYASDQFDDVIKLALKEIEDRKI